MKIIKNELETQEEKNSIFKKLRKTIKLLNIEFQMKFHINEILINVWGDSWGNIVSPFGKKSFYFDENIFEIHRNTENILCEDFPHTNFESLIVIKNGEITKYPSHNYSFSGATTPETQEYIKLLKDENADGELICIGWKIKNIDTNWVFFDKKNTTLTFQNKHNKNKIYLPVPKDIEDIPYLGYS